MITAFLEFLLSKIVFSERFESDCSSESYFSTVALALTLAQP